MSILAQQAKNPRIKPKWWGSLGMVESVVRYNCMKRGFPVPVLAMPFWEGAGNKVYDVSGKMNHGTMLNGAKWVAGMRSNTALQFDGVNDYVNCGNGASLNITDAITIEAWVNVNSTNSGYTKGIVGKNRDDVGGANKGFVLGEYNNKWLFWISGTVLQPVTSYIFNKWYHIVGVYDGQMRIYENGILIAGPTAATLVSNIDTVLIGRWYREGDAQRHFNGTIDEVRIYNRALTAAQIKYLYDNPYFMYEMPEELWGYTAAVGGATHPGWLWNKSGWF